MRHYTQEEFDALPVVDGRKQCPTGDYSAIRNFPEQCVFGKRCSFGAACYFGELCSFRELCYFGEQCRFGEQCSFGEQCRFDRLCRFGAACDFGKGCSFGAACYFGELCSFGELCGFEGGYSPRDYSRPFITVGGIGSVGRTVYVFDFEDGLMIRAGCFFGTEEELLKCLKYDQDPHKERVYPAAVELAKLQFQSEGSAQ